MFITNLTHLSMRRQCRLTRSPTWAVSCARVQLFSLQIFCDSQIMLIGHWGSFKLTLVLLRLPWRLMSSFFLRMLLCMALVLDCVNSSTYTSLLCQDVLFRPPRLLIQMSFETPLRRSKLLRFPWYGTRVQYTVLAYGSSTWPEWRN